MAKISTYVIDGTIVDDDKVIGSDANNSMQTKNYTIGDLVGYFAASIGNDYLVPYIGANDNVDLGAFDLSATNITISGNFIANGTEGLPGQALLSQGSGLPSIWGYVTGSQDLASVLNIGNFGSRNIYLNTINGHAWIDVEKTYGEPAMYLYSDTLDTSSSWAIDKLHLEGVGYEAEYSANKIRYTSGSDYVDIILNSYNNQSFILPAVGGFIPVSVNGVFSDASGNITIPTGGISGSGTPTQVAFWNSASSLSSDSNLYWNNSNKRLGIGNSNPLVRLHVGDGGGVMGFPYEESIVEKNGDTKFGVYTSVDDAGNGGASYVLGYTNFITNLGYYPGFEYQFVGDFVDTDNYIRFNFLQRNSGGYVVGSNANIFNLYADSRVSFKTLIGSGTRMVVTDAAGFISSQTIPSSTGGVPHATASGTDTYTATISGVTSYTDGDSYIIQFTNGNTTGCTLNINGLGAITLYRNNDGALIGGDIAAGGEMLCVYDNTINGFRAIGTTPNTLVAYVTNDDSVTITKGQVVYAFSGTGDRMTVKLASNSSEATSAQTFGVVMSSSIAPNQKGFVITQGLLDGLSILPTASYTDGDPLYLGATAGSITKVKPSAPNHLVYLGNVTTASNGAAGRWYVRVQNGYELQELHNVAISSVANNDGLFYESSTSLWKNKSIATVLGYTPFQLPALTSGSVLFSNGTTIAQNNANFFWDNTNTRLGVGTSTPSYLLDVNGIGRFSNLLYADTDILVNNYFAINTTSTTIPYNMGIYRRKGNGYFTHLMEDEQGGAQHKWALIQRSGFNQTRDWYNDNSSILNINLGWGNSNASNLSGNTLLINPTLNLTNALLTNLKIRGVYYNPTITSITNTTHIAFENTSGDIIHGNLSGVGTRMVTADSTGKLGVQSIPTSGAPAGSTGYVQFNTSGAFNADANLFWDNTNKRLGIGTSSPSTNIQIDGTSTVAPVLSFNTSGALNNNQYIDYKVSNSSKFQFGYTTSGSINRFFIYNNVATNDGLRIYESTNNVALGTTGASTDAGYKLDVNGTARLNGTTLINTASNPNANTFRVGGDGAFSGGITAENFPIVTAGQISTGGSTISNSSYRLTNGGSDITPKLMIRTTNLSTSGLRFYSIDTTSQLSFNAYNSGSIGIARASIGITNLTNTAGSESGDMIFLTQSGGTAMSEKMRITSGGGITLTATNTAAGTTGNQTINKASGTVNIAAAGTTVTVTNSLVTASSIVFAVIRTNDATAVIKNVVPGAGSFVINLNAATTAETSIGFFVIN